MPFHTKNYQMFAEHADSEILMPQMNTQIFGITAQRVYISQQRKTHVKSKISNYARSKSMGNGVTVSNTASVSQQQIIDSLTAKLAKANERVEELECSVDKANEMLEEVRASGDLGLYMDNKLTAFLVGDSEQLRKEQE